jgi:hypothetical protein
MDFYQNLRLLLCEENIKKMKRPATDWEKVFATHISDTMLGFRICKAFL